MNNSTQGVTLLSGFFQDVLKEYQHMKKVCKAAFDMAKDIDMHKADEWYPMEVYNNICDWIEQNIGVASIRSAGIAIGNRAYENIVSQNKIENPTPLGMMEALKWAASNMIQDPQGRGWEILKNDDFSIVMRRTQTFNCMLQEGLLTSLVERTGAEGVDVEHEKCTRHGDEFCEYRITWLG